MYRLLLLFALFGVGSAHAEGEKVSATIKGMCRTVTLAGKPDRCLDQPEVRYTVFDNGRVMVSAGLWDGRVVAFVAEKDSQPSSEAYYMYLSRVRVATLGSQLVANIGGQCVINMARDGKSWSRVFCNATDENGAVYALDFQSDGQPVTVTRPGDKPPVVSEEHPNAGMIGRVTSRFKASLKVGGIQGVARDVASCYDKARFNIPSIRSCVLYDSAAITMDMNMRQVFREKGTDPGPPPPFFFANAIKDRSAHYAALAFGGSEELMASYLGTAPTTVMQGLLK